MKNIISILFIFSFVFPKFSFSSVNTSGTMGSVTINGEIYNHIAIRPEIPIGKMGIGLDMYIYFNDEGIYEGNWNFDTAGDTYKTIIDKLYYVRWAQPGEPLYFRVGALEQVSLGYGILVRNYSNTMQYPGIKRIGLDYRMQITHNIGIDLIHSNFKNITTPGVLAGRVWYDLSPKLQIAASFARDGDQHSALFDGDGDSVPYLLDPFPEDGNKWLDSDGDGIADEEDNDIDGDGWDIDGFTDTQIDSLDNALDILNDLYDTDEYYIDSDTTITRDEVFKLGEDDFVKPISAFGVDISYKLTNKVKLYG